ncbi:hypothetical protein [Halegenticoccus soli]|uniref:hypothetical protein n=1 Tax=Halegenticoccus soli TaxID=1985678 RepID=UPI00117B3E50|nr:hypothetical protein [Halegenticoccus soli]
MEPLTSDIIPPSGWTVERFGRDEVRFRPERWRIAVEAKHVPGHGWELRCRESAGEASSVRSLGYAPTRQAAIQALFSCMRGINRAARRAGTDAPMTLASLVGEMAGRPDVRPMSADWRRAAPPSATSPPTEPADRPDVGGRDPERPWRAPDRREEDESDRSDGSGRESDGGSDGGSNADPDDGSSADSASGFVAN